jgi:hypothetical protein
VPRKHRLFDPAPGSGRQHQRLEQIRLTDAARVCAGCPATQRCPSVTTATAVTVEVIPAPRRSPPRPGVLRCSGELTL